MHKIKNHTIGKKRWGAYKLDMSKAYNRVEWVFLKEMMMRMSFCEVRIEIVIRCVNSASFSIIINGQPCGLIYAKKEFRQGYPLSPYLFFICSERSNMRNCFLV